MLLLAIIFCKVWGLVLGEAESLYWGKEIPTNLLASAGERGVKGKHEVFQMIAVEHLKGK